MYRTTISLICGMGLLAGAGEAAAQKPAPKAEPSESTRAMTSSDVGRSGLEGAVTTPLRDANLIRAEIPEVLTRAVVNPYARPAKLTCAALRPEITALNDALGEDFDEAAVKEDGTRSTAYGLVSSAVADVIPMRGWLRKLSGAEKHDKRVQEAILAGAARRGYLKGLGQSKGCKAPSAPRPVVASAPRPAAKK